jgi:hypothetical protein
MIRNGNPLTLLTSNLMGSALLPISSSVGDVINFDILMVETRRNRGKVTTSPAGMAATGSLLVITMAGQM